MSGCFSLNAPKIEIIDETRKREKLNYLKPKGTIRNDKGTIWIELTFYWLKFILMVRLKIVFAFGQKIIGWEKNLFCRKKDQHLLLVFLFSLIVEWTLYFSLATLFLSWDKHFTGARALWQVYLIFLSECLNKMTSHKSTTTITTSTVSFTTYNTTTIILFRCHYFSGKKVIRSFQQGKRWIRSKAGSAPIFFAKRLARALSGSRDNINLEILMKY